MAGFSKGGDADLLIGYECSFFSLTCKVKFSIDSGNNHVSYDIYTLHSAHSGDADYEAKTWRDKSATAQSLPNSFSFVIDTVL